MINISGLGPVLASGTTPSTTRPFTRSSGSSSSSDGSVSNCGGIRGDDSDFFVAPPLLRLTLVRAAHDLWFLVMAIHHLIMDGWSLEIVFRDLADAYQALGDVAPSSMQSLVAEQTAKECAFKATVKWEDQAMALARRTQRERRILVGFAEVLEAADRPGRRLGHCKILSFHGDYSHQTLAGVLREQ